MRIPRSLIAAIVGLLPALVHASPEPVDQSQLAEIQVKYKGKKERLYCFNKTSGTIKLRTNQIFFTALSESIKKAKKSGDKSKLKKLTALQKQAKPLCIALPSPTPTPPIPTATPTPEPTPPSVYINFDIDGNVTDAGRALFQIPVGLPANVSLGRFVLQRYCTGCHIERVNRTFPDIRESIRRAPMLYDEQQIPDSELAHLIAYLNRFRL